jgi:hypothetical protein
MSPRPIDLDKLIGHLLGQPWQKSCVIIQDYMHPTETTRPRCVVRFSCPEWKYPSFLRYGPKQGFFWDVYGDDLQSPELAILAIHQAPAPRNVSPIEISIPVEELMGCDCPDKGHDPTICASTVNLCGEVRWGTSRRICGQPLNHRGAHFVS